jgi:hypothetical protein
MRKYTHTADPHSSHLRFKRMACENRKIRTKLRKRKIRKAEQDFPRSPFQVQNNKHNKARFTW